LREIRLLQYISHQNIIRIYDALETNNHVNLLLELVQGNSLAKVFKVKPFKANEVKSIVFQIATALNYLHQRHITHRDIKLENVLIIEQTQSIKLIDFGFSTLFHRDIKKKMFCGTPSYMAPEIVQKSVYRGQ
jgi:MAP/microtubule affinity-regulating kinase